LSQIKKRSQEGRQRIRKRQKLIIIADKSKDGWQVEAEYESDDLASGSKDEKRLRKAREAASRKRRQKEQLSSDRGKKPRIALGAAPVPVSGTCVEHAFICRCSVALALFYCYSAVFCCLIKASLEPVMHWFKRCLIYWR